MSLRMLYLSNMKFPTPNPTDALLEKGKIQQMDFRLRDRSKNINPERYRLSYNHSMSSPRRRESIPTLWNKSTFLRIPAFAGMTLGSGKKYTFTVGRYFLNSLLGCYDSGERYNKVFSCLKAIKEKFFRFLFPLLAIGLVSCTIEDMPELNVESVSMYAEPDANQNSAIAVDLVLIYNQELVKTIGKMSAGKYFASSRQLLLDNPSLLDIWHWELIPGQIVDDFSPTQDKGDAYAGYVFANYLTPGDHRVKVAPDGIVKILLLRDDMMNLAKFNTHDVNMGTTMSDVVNAQDGENYETPCDIKLGPTRTYMPSCQRRAPPLCQPPQPCKRKAPTLCAIQKTQALPCLPPSQGRPIQIITRPLNPPRRVAPKPYDYSR